MSGRCSHTNASDGKPCRNRTKEASCAAHRNARAGTASTPAAPSGEQVAVAEADPFAPTPGTTSAERTRRLSDLLEHFNAERRELEDHPSDTTDMNEPLILVEQHLDTGRLYLTSHADAVSARSYHEEQDSSEDWTIESLVDLERDGDEEGPALACLYCGKPALEDGGCDDCYTLRSEAWGRYHIEGGPRPDQSRDYCHECGVDIGPLAAAPSGRPCATCTLIETRTEALEAYAAELTGRGLRVSQVWDHEMDRDGYDLAAVISHPGGEVAISLHQTEQDVRDHLETAGAGARIVETRSLNTPPVMAETA